MNQKNKSLASHGFTLIELAIVLFIVSLLLGGLLMPYATSVEQREREDTAEALEDIKEALYGHALVNGYLPCPDCETGQACAAGTPDDGIEDRNGNLCSVTLSAQNTYTGNLPWATLGVPQFDAWEKPFTYSVTDTFSNDAVPFTLTDTGTIDILDQDGAATARIAQSIPAIVVSHGKDHYVPAQSADQVENYERDANIYGTTNSILTAYSGDNAGEFVFTDYRLLGGNIDYDDMMIWISPFVLKNRMIAAGQLP